jgi:hypothetical protein
MFKCNIFFYLKIEELLKISFYFSKFVKSLENTFLRFFIFFYSQTLQVKIKLKHEQYNIFAMQNIKF